MKIQNRLLGMRSWLIALFFFSTTAVNAQFAHPLGEHCPDQGFCYSGGFYAWGDQWLFMANTPDAGREIWITDGTEAGTRLFLDIDPGPTSGFMGFLTNNNDPSTLLEIDDRFYFIGRSSNTSNELWSSDGTVSGTSIVKDVSEGIFSGVISHGAVVYKDNIYFSGRESSAHEHPWRSDGTPEGTFRFHYISWLKYFTPEFEDAVVFNDRLYFVRRASVTSSSNLWVTDGTQDGSVALTDFGLNPGIREWIHELMPTELNGKLLFHANERNSGYELWATDGTPEGTEMLRDINTSSEIGARFRGIFFDGHYIFAGNDPDHGYELWKTDGTPAGTEMIADIFPGPQHGADWWMERAVILDNVLYFMADDGQHGKELWKLASANSAPEMVKDINPGPASSMNRMQMIALNDHVLFAAGDGTTNTEFSALYRTDGTVAGTELVSTIQSGNVLNYGFHRVDDQAYFAAWTAQYGKEIWLSDGTSGGTRILEDIDKGEHDGWGRETFTLEVVNNRLFFSGYTWPAGTELYTVGDYPLNATEPTAPEPLGLPFPNPTTGQLSFPTAWTTSGGQLELFNVQGQQAGSWSNVPSSIDLSHLPPGIYTLRLATSTEVVTNRVVKQ